MLRVYGERSSRSNSEKRKGHGSKRAHAFRDPVEADRVCVLFEWDEQGWKSFVSDPEVLAILTDAGRKMKPQMTLRRRVQA